MPYGFLSDRCTAIFHQTAGSLLAILIATIISTIAARSYHVTQQPFYKAIFVGVVVFLGLALAFLLIAIAVNRLRKPSDQLPLVKSGTEKAAIEVSPAYIDLQEKYVEVSAQLAGKKQQMKEESRKLLDMTEQRNAVQSALSDSRSTVAELEQEIGSLQARDDEFQWLRDIADEQAKEVPSYLSLESRIEDHRLVGDDPFIDIGCFVRNHAVYQITLENALSGHVYFNNHRLTREPTLLPDNRVRNVSLNQEKWFGIHQSLTPNEAAEILSNGGQFGLYDLHAKITTNPNIAGIAEPIQLDLRDAIGPIVDAEFLKNHYPKVAMDIKPSDLRSYFQYRKNEQGADLPTERLGTVVTLWVRLQNPRPLKVRLFKLVTSGPVPVAQTGEILETPHRDATGRHVLKGEERYPNLADLRIEVDRGNITEGWLQFIVLGVEPEKMLDPSKFVARLHVVDESGEEHKQDVTEFKLAF